MEDYKLEAQKLIKQGRLSKNNAILAIKILQHNQKLGKNYTFHQILIAKKFLIPETIDTDSVGKEKKTGESIANQNNINQSENAQKTTSKFNNIESWELEEITPINKSSAGSSANQNKKIQDTNIDSLELEVNEPINKNIVTSPVVVNAKNEIKDFENMFSLELDEITPNKKREKVAIEDDLSEQMDLIEKEASQNSNSLFSQLKFKITIGSFGLIFLLLLIGFFSGYFSSSKQILIGELKTGTNEVSTGNIEMKSPPQNPLVPSGSFSKEKVLEKMILVYGNEQIHSDQVGLGYLIDYMGEKYILLNSTNTQKIIPKGTSYEVVEKLIFKFRFLQGDPNFYEATVFYNTFALILRPINQKMKVNGFTLNPLGAYQQNKNLTIVGIDPPNVKLKEKDITAEKLIILSAHPSSRDKIDYNPNFALPITLEKEIKGEPDSMICINPLFELVGMQNNSYNSTPNVEREIELSKTVAGYFHKTLPEKSIKFMFKNRTKEGESIGVLQFKSPYYFPETSKYKLTISSPFRNDGIIVTKNPKLENNIFVTELTLLKGLAEKHNDDEIKFLKYDLKLCLEIDQGSGFKKIIDDINFDYIDNNETTEQFELEFKPLDLPFKVSFFEPTENGQFILICPRFENFIYVYSVVENKIITSINIESPVSILSRGDLLFVASNNGSDISLYKISEKENWKIINKYKIDSKELGGMSAPKGNYFKDFLLLYSTDSVSSCFLFNHNNGEVKKNKIFGSNYPCFSFNGENLLLQSNTDFRMNSVAYISFQKYIKGQVSENGFLDEIKEIDLGEKIEYLQQYSNGILWIADNSVFWGFPPHRISKKFKGILIGEYNLPLCYNLYGGVLDIYSADLTMNKLGSKSYHFNGAKDIFTNPVNTGYAFYGSMLTKIVTNLDKTYIFTYNEEKLFMCSFDSIKPPNAQENQLQLKPDINNEIKPDECNFKLLPIGEPSQCMALAIDKKELLIGSQCTNKILVWNITENKISQSIELFSPKFISIKYNIAYILSDDENATITVLDGSKNWSVLNTYQTNIKALFYFRVETNSNNELCVLAKAKNENNEKYVFNLTTSKLASLKDDYVYTNKANVMTIEGNQTNILFSANSINKIGQIEPLYMAPAKSCLLPDLNKNEFFEIMAGDYIKELRVEKINPNESHSVDNSTNEKESIEKVSVEVLPLNIYRMKLDGDYKVFSKMKITGISNINEIISQEHYGCNSIAFTQDEVTKFFIFNYDKSAIMYAESKFNEEINKTPLIENTNNLDLNESIATGLFPGAFALYNSPFNNQNFILQGNSLKIFDAEFSKTINSVFLSKDYLKMGERKDYFLFANKKEIDLLSKDTFKIIKTIELEGKIFFDFALIPETDISFVSVIDTMSGKLKGFETNRILQVDEKSGEVGYVPNILGKSLAISPDGEYLFTDILPEKRKYENIEWKIAKEIKTDYRYPASFLLNYKFTNNGLVNVSVTPLPKNSNGIIFDPKGTSLAVVDSFNLVKVHKKIGNQLTDISMKAVNDLDIKYVDKIIGSYKLDYEEGTLAFDYNSQYDIVAIGANKTIHFFNKSTYDEINDLKIDTSSFSKKTLKVAFTPSGENIFVVFENELQEKGFKCIPIYLSKEQKEILKIKKPIIVNQKMSLPKNKLIKPWNFEKNKMSEIKVGLNKSIIGSLTKQSYKTFSAEELIDETQKSMVGFKSGDNFFLGVFVGKSGYVLTVASNISFNDDTTVIYLNAKGEPQSVNKFDIISWDDEKNLALINLHLNEPVSYVPISKTPMNVGDKLVLVESMGFTGKNFQLQFKEGVFGNEDVVLNGSVYKKFNIKNKSGSNGSPYFDKNGNLVGLFYYDKNVNILGLAISFDNIVEFLNKNIR